MMLDGPSCSLPAFEPMTLYSFYPHPLSPRSHLHSTLLHDRHKAALRPSTQPRRSKREVAASTKHDDGGGDNDDESGNASILRPSREDVRESLKRAERRALMGRRPAGTGLGKDDEDVIVDEDMLDHEQHDINMFGHRFLLPYGRRLTQMEMDAAPSPSPSDPDHERRQEDRTMGSAGSPLIQPRNLDDDDEGDEEDGGVVDLDASIEDLDASEIIEDEGSMEEE
ncbi:hypothetical protein I316_02755 [Kwoniella heveanensis BCC8398]|uniref:Uncharacterized protein n=1 Tax=Kwoniella heveanensis BCC8398 TaxID=1296120 RepID=A0A1B9GXG8_9TREE|nr:hypothetical protein I316_02755 [Kwoniella heveanensis BCC8398]